MQTFLPYKSFTKSAKCLDYRRLGKQRVECIQIWKANNGTSTAWRNHHATLMWKDHPQHFLRYWSAMIEEWIERGYRNTIEIPRVEFESEELKPWWLGNRRFHSSHKAALLEKQPYHYEQFGWSEEPKLDYFWPTKERIV